MSAAKKRNIWITVLCLVCVLIAAVAFAMIYTATHYTVTYYRELSPLVQGNIRIVFLTDLHDREYGKGSENLIQDIEGLKPDLILLGGDMISRRAPDTKPMLSLFEKLSAIAPVYGVLGNHESERVYSYGDTALIPDIRATGVRLLRNEDDRITIGNNTVHLIGVEGTEAGFDLYGARESLDQMRFSTDELTIMLAHIPVLFREKLLPYPFQLGFAGHVHGGIIRLPYVGALYSAEEGFFPHFSKGRYLLLNGGNLIISGGMGDSARVPRINNMPELVVVDIKQP